jgi:charged multivesicular body protein 4
MMALKRKKQLEVQLSRIDQQINNVEQVNMSVQDASTNVDVLNAQVQGAQSIKKVYKSVGGIDKVDKVMDDVRDAMDISNELSTALSQDIGGGAIVDEDDLENELAELEMENEDAQDLEIKTGHKMLPIPAPGSKKEVKQSTEESELAALEASMT